jgi:hypothetical protein
MDLHLAHVRYLRGLLNTPTMRSHSASETVPGADVAASDELLAGYVRANSTLSFMHPCCTAAMMPRSKGGVVGTDLRVHGAKGLRVVDMSVLPLLPGAHLSATAYAVGEKVSFFFSSFFFWSSPLPWCFADWLARLVGGGYYHSGVEGEGVVRFRLARLRGDRGRWVSDPRLKMGHG